MNSYIYGRVSHQSSALSGLSEANQYQYAKGYCDRILTYAPPGAHHWPATSPDGYFFDKAVSAWRQPFAARPAARELLSVLKPNDHVVFYSVDRGFRSVSAFSSQVESWLACGITPHFVHENINFGTAIGRLMGNVMASVAQYYSDVISERTREALRIKRLREIASEQPKRKRYKWLNSDVCMTNHSTPVPLSSHRPGRIFTYARCSHHDSMLSGLGMEQQIAGVESYAQQLATQRPWLTVNPEVFRDESVSAFNFEFNQRPSGKRLLSMLQPGDQLVVYRLDRAWRLPHDAARMAKELAASGVGIHIVDASIDTQSEFGEMWVTLLSVFAYLESKIKSTRNTEVAALCRASGRPYSPIPRQFKVVTSNGTRRLIYDFEKIKRMAVCYICRKVLGYSEKDTCEIIHAIDSALSQRAPVWIGLRRGMWGERNHTSKSTTRFAELITTLPKSQLFAVLDEAQSLLEMGPDSRFVTHCRTLLPISNVRSIVNSYFANYCP